MRKLHLPAVVPSEGARLLARRICSAYRGDLPFASRCMQLPMTTLQYLVDGTLTPDEDLVRDIARATMHAIGGSAWRSPPLAGWLDTERGMA